VIALLAGGLRASRTLIAQHVSRVLGTAISAGAVDAAIRRVGRVLHDPWRALDEAIKHAEVVHADETTWLTKGDPCLLWVAAAAPTVCFRIDPRRTQEAAKRLLGADFGGFVVSDRYVGYHWLDVLQQQLCWSHLTRQLRSLSERRGAPGALGARLLEVAGEVFKAPRAL
jgi:transposase